MWQTTKLHAPSSPIFLTAGAWQAHEHSHDKHDTLASIGSSEKSNRPNEMTTATSDADGSSSGGHAASMGAEDWPQNTHV